MSSLVIQRSLWIPSLSRFIGSTDTFDFCSKAALAGRVFKTNALYYTLRPTPYTLTSCVGSDRFGDASVLVRNRAPASNANRISRNNQGRRQLASLEFIRGGFDTIENVVHQICRVPRPDNLIRRTLLFKVQLQDRVEFVVRR